MARRTDVSLKQIEALDDLFNSERNNKGGGICQYAHADSFQEPQCISFEYWQWNQQDKILDEARKKQGLRAISSKKREQDRMAFLQQLQK